MATTSTGSPAAAPSAQAAILALFDRYSAVGGFSPAHGNKDVDDFLLGLIRNPALPGKVTDLAIECGNSRYQAALDQYVGVAESADTGSRPTDAQIAEVWRDTTQPTCAFSTFYEQLVPLVKDLNSRLPAAQRLRILALDPPVDWSKVRSAADLAPYRERETTIAKVMETEVFAKHRKALLLIGSNHVRHGQAAAALWEKDYPNLTYSIATHERFTKDAETLEPKLATGAGVLTPTLTNVRGSFLADLDSSVFPDGITDDNTGGTTDGHGPAAANHAPGSTNASASPQASKGYPGIDGYLYVGPSRLLLSAPISPTTATDQAFLAEAERRAKAIDAPADAPMHPANVINQAAKQSVLLYAS
ncbi:hypothetical protein GCM10009839_19870 [Catenulispora yoronensis]|uniref:Uncharacterized protein n=1 Tax=Catenulispora yoronensis TaxID=450799 RepID=A0ABP5FBV1_9ACTN